MKELFKLEKAPSPERGNAKLVYTAILEFGDITDLDLGVLLCCDDDKAKGSMSVKSIKSTLHYLIQQGYVVFLRRDGDVFYKVASLKHFRQKQETVKYPREFAKRRGRWNAKPRDFGPSNRPRREDLQTPVLEREHRAHKRYDAEIAYVLGLCSGTIVAVLIMVLLTVIKTQ